MIAYRCRRVQSYAPFCKHLTANAKSGSNSGLNNLLHLASIVQFSEQHCPKPDVIYPDSGDSVLAQQEDHEVSSYFSHQIGSSKQYDVAKVLILDQYSDHVFHTYGALLPLPVPPHHQGVVPLKHQWLPDPLPPAVVQWQSIYY